MGLGLWVWGLGFTACTEPLIFSQSPQESGISENQLGATRGSLSIPHFSAVILQNSRLKAYFRI